MGQTRYFQSGNPHILCRKPASPAPPMNATDMDTNSITALVHEMRGELKNLNDKVASISGCLASADRVVIPSSAQGSTSTIRPQVVSGPSHNGDQVMSWADRVGSGSPSRPSGGVGVEDGFNMVGQGTRPKPINQPRRLCGKKNTCKVRTVQRQCSVFAGRFQPDTSCEEVIDILTCCNIPVTSCYKLPAISKKTGYQFKSAAFKVSFNAEHLEKVFSKDVWPDDCDLREWVYTERKGAGAADSDNR